MNPGQPYYQLLMFDPTYRPKIGPLICSIHHNWTQAYTATWGASYG